MDTGLCKALRSRYSPETMSADNGSRIPGFYRLTLDERRGEVTRRAGLSPDDAAKIWDGGGLDPVIADKVVENVLGVYALPFGVALNAQVNGEDRLIPMVVEEPSVIAAASNAARMIRAGGGFTASMLEDLMTAQVQLFEVPDGDRAEKSVKEHEAALLDAARNAVPNLIERGGGPHSLEVRNLGNGLVVVHVHVDVRDAMGANLVNTVAEALGPELARLCGGKLGLRIVTNLCDRRRVHVRAVVPARDLVMGRPGSNRTSWAPTTDANGKSVAEAIERASRFAEADPYRAATHNKGVMNGIDSVVIATGNDYRAVEAGAHAFAVQKGRYRPLSTWRVEAEELVGELELPLALGIVGGTLRVHPAARLALELARVKSAADLSMLAACVGLASNLAALRALATEGIQQGHMSLHARSVASAAGAEGDEVERVALALVARKDITMRAATEALSQLRGAVGGDAGS